jgi:hypothetical protein
MWKPHVQGSGQGFVIPIFQMEKQVLRVDEVPDSHSYKAVTLIMGLHSASS